MPFSYGYFDSEVVDFVNNNVSPSYVLDIGPGAGKWGTLLKQPGRTIDCIEIFEPYVRHYGLKTIYDNVYVGDAREFRSIIKRPYNLAILGDVLEHLSVPDAQHMIEEMTILGMGILVLVPYNYEQGECFGNVFEKHEQPDLTEAVFRLRYPAFRKLRGNEHHGVFYKAFSYAHPAGL